MASVIAIDGSTLARRALREALRSGGGIELLGVVGTTAAAQHRMGPDDPDVIVLDLEADPEGWAAALAQLRAAHPRSRIVALAPDTREGHAAMLQALSCGAIDSLARPAGEAPDSFRQRLLRVVRSAAASLSSGYAPAAAALPDGPLPAPRKRTSPSSRVDCVVVGVSTGGPNALAQILPALPRDFPAPILIVQHMPPGFSGHLARSLALHCRIEVREAANGVELRPGLALLAPGGRHLVVERRARGAAAALRHGAPQNFCRPSADVLFRSAAEVFGAGTLALVLTGMGHDGLLGAQSIADAGGRVLVQDQGSSVVWGMPGAVAHAGLADTVLPLADVAEELLRRVELSRAPRTKRGS